MTRILFFAPLKAPDHPVPSGDRTVGRLIVRALKGVLTGLARQRFVVIELGAHAGSRRLEEGVAGEKLHSRERVEVCRVLVELAERQRFGRPRSRRAKKKTLDPERDLCHPNAKHVEKELIAMVKGER